MGFTGADGMDERESSGKEQDPGIAADVTGSAGNDSDTAVLQGTRGHGFAGERANHPADPLSGEKAELVGGEFRRDGADWVVNGFEIQTKYCRIGSECIAGCFRDGRFRYLGSNGPMLIEAPYEKYDAPLQATQHRIRTRQVPGVSDPVQAKAIVRKGHFTYEKVKRIPELGAVESLT